MRQRKLLLLVLVVLFAAGRLAASQSAGPLPVEPNAKSVRAGEVVVELVPGADIEAVNARNRTNTKARLYGTNFYRLTIPPKKKEKKWRKRLAKDPDVLSASLNPLVSNPSLFARATASFPDGYASPGFTAQDFRGQSDLFDLLQLNDVLLRSTGKGVVVAVIDTGVEKSHSAVLGRLWSNPKEVADLIDNDGDGLVDDIDGWNFVDNSGDVNEGPGDPKTTVAGHGTFIAGLIAMLAPGARIMPLRAFPPDGLTEAFTVATAVKYAADHGADVISLSLGSSETSDLLQEAILDACARGITVVAAVGNDGTDADPKFPSTMDEVIAVAAIDNSGQRAYFSNFGKHVDVCAPGFQLISAFPWRQDGQGDYALWSGTSFAAPLAAAEAALVLSADPQQPDVKNVIETTAVGIDNVNPGFEGKLGKGRIWPLGALKFVGAGDARPVADRRYQINLTTTLDGGDSFGRATVNVSGSSQKLVVEAYKANPRAQYSLVVDGATIASAVPASNLGSIRFSFFSDGSTTLPAPINPVTRARHIEVRSSNVAVLTGDFGGDTNPVAGYIQREAQLVSAMTGHASGSALIKVEALADQTRRETLLMTAENLAADGYYRFVVDGFPIGGLAPATASFFRRVLTSDGSSGLLLPSPLRPVTNIRRVELLDAFGQTVASGTFPASAQRVHP